MSKRVKKQKKRGFLKPKKTKKTKLREESPEYGIKKIKVRLIGIGGGGGSIVSEIAQRVKGASFYVANSDLKALARLSRKVRKFHFGQELTHGLGTGMNPLIGQEAAKREEERIKQILEGQDFVIIVSCLGGGLGSGAAPIFANVSKKMGNLTYGIFTLPFKFEGAKKMEIAKEALERIKPELNAFSVIPNERIFQIIERTAPLKKALSSINNNLSESLQSLIEIIYRPGLINIDFADLRTIFKQKGRLAYLNSIELGREEEKEAVEKVINSPLYPYSIDGAKGVLLNISGQKDLSLNQVTQISKVISKKAYRSAKVIFGISGAKKGSKFRVSLLATGCASKIFVQQPPKKQIKEIKPKPPVSKEPVILEEKQKKPSFSKAAKGKGKKKVVKKPKLKTKTEKKVVSRKKIKKRKIKVRIAKKKAKQEEKEVKIRKNALQVKKEIEEEEAAIISKEKFWETPTFLRKKTI